MVRKLEISHFRRALREEGFYMPERVAMFLKSFGELEIKQANSDYFHFDVIKAVSGVDPDWVKEYYREQTHEELCIIGEAFNEYMVLCMSSAGSVYAGFDDTLVYVGASGEEAVEALLCSGHELPEVVAGDTPDSDYTEQLVPESHIMYRSVPLEISTPI
ncbi:SUKH-3 domain-containing protein [Desulfococcaceae bacterium HSG8]|nr:SUKH-3 domain-containing protein [Desulfococcaceae bacterium HSG8]